MYWSTAQGRDKDLLKRVQRWTTKMIRGLKHLSHVETLRDLGCLARRRESSMEILLWPFSKYRGLKGVIVLN